MVVEKLSMLLREQGYMQLDSSMKEYLLFLTGDFERAQLIEIIDLSHGFQITHEQLKSVEHNTKSAFEDQGYHNLHFFTLLITDRADSIIGECSSEWACWVVDIENRKLCINEEQAEDFYGLRSAVEHALDEQYVIEPAKNSKEQFATGNGGAEARKKEGVLRRNFTHMNSLIVIINVLVFIVLTFMGNTENVDFMAEHGAMYAPYVLLDGEYYRLITSMFLHFGIDHLLGNMVGLYFLGDNLERAVGKIRYLLIYFVSGIIAAVGSMVYYILLRQPVVSAGASGAIFGVIGALLYIVIRNKGKLEDLTTGRIVVFIAFCIYSGLTSRTTDNAAHLCGLVAGLVLSVLLYRKPKIRKIPKDTE